MGLSTDTDIYGEDVVIEEITENVFIDTILINKDIINNKYVYFIDTFKM